MKNKILLLTITIPTYNEERDLGDCLKSIAGQNFLKEQYEVIIVDNYSTDKTVEIARSFAKKINVKVIMNEIKDAEVSKKLGYGNSKGEFFMYFDADMRFGDRNFIKKMLFPFQDDDRIVGNFVQFQVNKKHPPVTRVLSYDKFQRDPILEFFTIGVEDVIVEKRKDYWLCKCSKNKIPPQGLMIYKKDLIKEYIKDKKQLIDNDIPVVLVEKGHEYFSFVPSTGVEHLILRSLKELWRKRIRNLERTYVPNVEIRKFKWINWKKDWPKVGIWMIYINSLIFPLLKGLYKSIKYKDSCFLCEPALNVISTYSMIYGVLSNRKVLLK